MGLTIHWTTHAPETDSLAEVTAKLSQWREACLDLPFEDVGEIQHFAGKELAWRLDDRSAPDRDLVLHGCAYFQIDPTDEESPHVSVDPVEVVGFTACAGDGCEWMTCLLARYPERALVGKEWIRPGIQGWRANSFAKTQYASMQGSENFLKCHLTITAALDAARGLRLLKSVLDEGGYWEERNVEKLLKTVGRWNEMMAGFVGALELATGENLPAPIKEHPQFERLEHMGTTGDTAAMAKAIAEALKKTKPSE
jgi:hypothetical protein